MQVGSIEGRVGVQHLDDAQQSKNFTFKCHREGNDIYSVNSLNFHPVSSNLMDLLLIYCHFSFSILSSAIGKLLKSLADFGFMGLVCLSDFF